MWKEVAMVQFKVLSWHLPEGTNKNRKNLSQDSLSMGWGSHQGNPKYKARIANHSAAMFTDYL
jgi:hypothetical protein